MLKLGGPGEYCAADTGITAMLRGDACACGPFLCREAELLYNGVKRESGYALSGIALGIGLCACDAFVSWR